MRYLKLNMIYFFFISQILQQNTANVLQNEWIYYTTICMDGRMKIFECKSEAFIKRQQKERIIKLQTQ